MIKMTNINELFNGISVIIDNAFNNDEDSKNDDIFKIKEIFESNNIPIVTYTEIPDNETINNFKNANFILLDWNLSIGGSQIILGDNIDFLHKMNEISLVPIFIFTKENPDEIKSILEEKNLYNPNSSNNIFIKQKSDLLRNEKGENDNTLLFVEIEKWFNATPSIYVLKEWEHSLNKAKQNLFIDFYNINPNWVNVIWQTLEKDKVNQSIELAELLFDNIHTRIFPIEFDNSILEEKELDKIDSIDIKKVLEGQRYLPYSDEYQPEMIFTGDLFLIDETYYLNVRPQCDCIPRKEININDINLYLIAGVQKTDFKKLSFSKKLGLFPDIETRSSIFPVHDNKFIQFQLGDFSLEKYQDIRDKRIGRILPPFINKIQQKYGLYMQRQGLPRIPEEAVDD
jgi:hypothetical protein